MKHQIMTVMLDAFLIINALPPKFLQKRFPYFFHGAFASSFIWSRRPCLRVLYNSRQREWERGSKKELYSVKIEYFP